MSNFPQTYILRVTVHDITGEQADALPDPIEELIGKLGFVAAVDFDMEATDELAEFEQGDMTTEQAEAYLNSIGISVTKGGGTK